MESPLFALFVSLVLAAIAITVRSAELTANMLLFAAWLVGCVGIARRLRNLRRFRAIVTVLCWALLGLGVFIFSKLTVGRERPRTAFLSAMPSEIIQEYSHIAPGKALAARINWSNQTKERLFKPACWAAAYVEHVDAETEKRVHRRFLEQSGPGRYRYFAGKTGGPEMAPNYAIGAEPKTPPLTEEQCGGLLRGTARLYLISWIGWIDSFGRRDSASQCVWIETPDSTITAERWHYCDE